MKYVIDISAAAGRKAVRHSYGVAPTPVVKEQSDKPVKNITIDAEDTISDEGADE